MWDPDIYIADFVSSVNNKNIRHSICQLDKCVVRGRSTRVQKHVINETIHLLPAQREG